MFKLLIKKILRPFKPTVVSLMHRLLQASGVEDQLQAISRQLDRSEVDNQLLTISHQLHDLMIEKNKIAELNFRWKDLVLPVLDVARQVRDQAEHPRARDLDIHYGHCVDLLMRHGKELDIAGQQIFKEDDWSLDYVKSINVYVPGGEAEPAADSKEYPLMGLLDDPNCAVFLVIGQSNAANHGDIPYQPKSDVYTLDFMNMHCYRANDPLPGASGAGGSIWSRLGDQLIAEGIYRKVLFVPIAFGGTFAHDWIQGGSMTRRLDLCLNRLYKAVEGVLPFSAVFWQQGEAEANHTDMSAETYIEHIQCLVASLRERFVVAPVFVATTTLCVCNSPVFDNVQQIRIGQHDLVMPEMGILAGPDLDQVGIDERYDACHLSDVGLNHCARLWLDVIRDAKPVLPKPRLGV